MRGSVNKKQVSRHVLARFAAPNGSDDKAFFSNGITATAELCSAGQPRAAVPT